MSAAAPAWPARPRSTARRRYALVALPRYGVMLSVYVGVRKPPSRSLLCRFLFLEPALWLFPQSLCLSLPEAVNRNLLRIALLVFDENPRPSTSRCIPTCECTCGGKSAASADTQMSAPRRGLGVRVWSPPLPPRGPAAGGRGRCTSRARRCSRAALRLGQDVGRYNTISEDQRRRVGSGQGRRAGNALASGGAGRRKEVLAPARWEAVAAGNSAVAAKTELAPQSNRGRTAGVATARPKRSSIPLLLPKRMLVEPATRCSIGRQALEAMGPRGTPGARGALES